MHRPWAKRTVAPEVGDRLLSHYATQGGSPCRYRSLTRIFLQESSPQSTHAHWPFDIRHVESVEEMIGATVGDLIGVYDLRNGGEKRSFKVVNVGRPTYSDLVEESSMALG